MDNKLIDPSLLTKSAISDKDLKIIKEQIDADFDKMKTGEKIAINLGTNNAHYLPPPTVVFNFLGFKYGIPDTIKKLENIGVKPLDIPRTSRYDLQNKGVGKRTYKKYIDWVIDLPISLLDNIIEGRNPKLDASAKTSSNAFHWITFLIGVTNSMQPDDELRPEYIPLIEFIEYRCDTEVDMQQRTSNRDDYESLSRSDTHIWWPQLAKPFFAKHTVFTSDILDSLDSFMVNGSVPYDLTVTEKNTLYKNLLRLKFDFILASISHYEVGIIISRCPDTESMRAMTPLTCHAITKYISHDESRTCFDLALQKLKDWCSETESGMSWREIASYIPVDNIDPNNASPTRHIDKQYSRLKDWRKGKNLPSNELLELFTTNIAESMGSHSEGDSLFILCRITIGLDKTLSNLVKEWSKDIGSKSQVSVIWKDVLSHYHEDYYLHYLNQHIAKIEKTT